VIGCAIDRRLRRLDIASLVRFGKPGKLLREPVAALTKGLGPGFGIRFPILKRLGEIT